MATLTPNMSLIESIISETAATVWAQNLNTSLTILDAHTHAPGSGVQITPPGMNINTDLPFNNVNNITTLRSLRFYPQVSALSGVTPDLGCLYEAGVDLYYNDGGGNQIRITQSGSLAGAAGTITGLPSGTASAAFSAASGTYIFQQATSMGANIDGGSLIVRYPGSYPTPTGNFISIQAPTSLASGYSITLPALPAQTNVMTLGNTGTISSVTFDAVGSTMTSTGANAVAASRTRTTGTSVGVGGVAISDSSGTYTTASTSFTSVTNLSVTITTSGRPVLIGLYPFSSATSSLININNTGYVSFLNSTSSVSYGNFGPLGGNFSPSSFWCITPLSAGTYTFVTQVKVLLSSDSMAVKDAVMCVYEL